MYILGGFAIIIAIASVIAYFRGNKKDNSPCHSCKCCRDCCHKNTKK